MLVDLVQTTTRDGVRLDGVFQSASAERPPKLALDGVCLVHGTGGSFYSSTLFDELAEHLLQLGCAVLRVDARGHDLMSTAATSRGGLRLGAAYERVDDCHHDLAAWTDWLRERAGPRIGLIGHSLGAVKCLYALVKEPPVKAACVVALSPPRLSYSWFCSSPEGASFLEAYHLAERYVEAGQGATLLEVKLPLPFVVSAAGYVEKYGPEEHYNYLDFLHAVTCPTLVTLGAIEVEKNMAFRGTPEAIATMERRPGGLTVVVIPGADHFYTGVRPHLLTHVENWLP